MNRKQIIPILVAACGGIILFSVTRVMADADEKPNATQPQIKSMNGETVVTLDAETQKRIGLEITNLTAVEWQPEVKGYGRVIDPTPLIDLLNDLGRAEITFDSSHQELERAKQLKRDSNISERAFQDAEATYEQNLRAVEAIYLKIESAWGRKIAGMTGSIVVPPGTNRKPDKFLEGLPDESVLIRVDLPAGERLESALQPVRVVSLAEKTAPVTAVCFDKLPAMDPQTQRQGFLIVADQLPTNRLTLGEAVTAFIKVPDKPINPISGAIVPASAVVRHEGRGWIYLQTAATEFTRRELPMDRAADGGFFSDKLSAKNRVVVVGVQAILSTELSNGGFNTGERD
jgi:membrane fusion protein, multidrug efflux system